MGYNVKGFISGEDLSGPEATFLFFMNMGIGIALVIFLGFLVHVGWNLA